MLLRVRPRWRTPHQLTVAAVAHLVLLAALSAVTGLGPVGWIAGVGVLVGLCGVLVDVTRRSGMESLGPADLVTLARAVLAGGVCALVAEQLAGGATSLVLMLLAVVTLALDAVDGQVARRTGTASPFGARFDMETDSFLVLVLSVQVAVLLGPWVLAIGLMRYAFVAAGWWLPWLRSQLPPRYSAKVVAAGQGIVLILAAADVLPRPLMTVLVGAALAGLVWSFGRDVVWLHRGHEHSWGWVLTLLAGALLFVVLVAPNQLGGLTPGAFARIPAEGLLGIAVLLALPWRSGRLIAALGGVGLGLLAVVKILDVGFFAVLVRPFNPLIDWMLFAPAVEFVAGSRGGWAAVGVVVGAVLLAIALVVAFVAAALRISRVVHQHRAAAQRSLLVFWSVWLACALLGSQLVPGVPVATADAARLVHERAGQVRAEWTDQQQFAAELGNDPVADSGTPLLQGLQGKDVVVAFVESYGRTATDDPHVDAVLDESTGALADAGFAARSAYLTSATSGARSWLGHSTFLSGAWVNSDPRYQALISSDRLTLTRVFRDAGWETTAVMPGTTRAWPEASFYGLDRVHPADDLGYRGPDYGWPTIPDQYTLAAFERLEHGRADRGPLMAEVVLASSHLPWQFTPPVLGWDQVGDGSAFTTFPPATGTERERYSNAVSYSLESLVSWVQTYGDDDLVLLVLGDHQPPIIGGESADVPISVVSRDPTVLDGIGGGWSTGLRPAPDAPVAGMDTFRDRFLTAFSR